MSWFFMDDLRVSALHLRVVLLRFWLEFGWALSSAQSADFTFDRTGLLLDLMLALIELTDLADGDKGSSCGWLSWCKSVDCGWITSFLMGRTRGACRCLVTMLKQARRSSIFTEIIISLSDQYESSSSPALLLSSSINRFTASWAFLRIRLSGRERRDQLSSWDLMV